MIKRFFKGLAFGAVAGSVAGVLLAPRSGKETRNKLVSDVDEAVQLTDDLSVSLQNFQTSLVHLKNTAGELLPEFKKETKQALDQYQFQAEPRMEEIQEQLAKIQSSIEEMR